MTIHVGERVKRSDADAPGAIPAYRDLRGVVVYVSPCGEFCRVRWGHGDEDANPRRSATVTVIP